MCNSPSLKPYEPYTSINSENVMLHVIRSLQNEMSRIPAVYSEHVMLDVVPIALETLQAVDQPYIVNMGC